MRNFIGIVAAALVAMLPSGVARGQVVFSTFGPGNSFSSTSRYVFGGSLFQAMRLTPVVTGTISRAELGVDVTGPSAGTMTVTILPDASGTPGSVPLWSASNGAVGARGIYVFDGPALTLLGGQSYWLVAQSNAGGADWWLSEPAAPGTAANNFSTGVSVQPVSALGAMRLSGDVGACCSFRTGACAVLSSGVCTGLGLLPIGAGSTCATVVCHPCPGTLIRTGCGMWRTFSRF